MNAIRVALSVVALIALPFSASAQDDEGEGGPFSWGGFKPYLGTGFSVVTAPRQRVGTVDNSSTFHPLAGIVRGGLVLNDWFDIEAHYGFNVEGDRINEAADTPGANNPKYLLDSMYGVKLRGKWYVTENEDIALYAQVGYGSIDFEVRGLDNVAPDPDLRLPEAITTEDISYGAGVRFDISPVSSLNIDWTATDSDQGEIHSIGIFVNFYLIELFSESEEEDEDDYYY